jgi:hypothetical protein
MPTQLSRLLRPPAKDQPDPLVERLKRHDPDAEREIARRYNYKIADHSRTIPEPPKGGTYDTYEPRLLALLWTLADNSAALRALGRRLGQPVPNPSDYNSLNDEMLARLWDLGRDSAALEHLWRRRGVLPCTIGPDTPENVLGFLSWQRHPGASDELLRRYCLFDVLLYAEGDKEYPGAASRLLERFHFRKVPRPCQSAHEFASLASEKLLQLVPLWDYVAYESIEHMLVKAFHNRLRDWIRQEIRQGSVPIDTVPEPPVLCCPGPDGPTESQETIARLPWDERVIRKAQNGVDLTDDELDWAARKNREACGETATSTESLGLERDAVARWLAENRSPTGDHLSKIFPWYKATQFGKASRVARMRLLIEEVDRYLAHLVHNAPDGVQELRQRVRQEMDELLRRTNSGNRPGKNHSRPGPVASFAGFDEASRRLLHLLGGQIVDRRRDEAFARLRDTFALFADLFPVLVKLSACRRLAQEVPGAAGLATWLDAGQQWLSSLHEADREQCWAFAESLASPGAQASGAQALLLAWLKSTQHPGPAEPSLLHVDRVWWLSQGRDELTEPAEALTGFARASQWYTAAETAAQMLRQLGPISAVYWSAEGELRASLERLRSRRRDLPARLETCRKLIDYLREQSRSVPPARLADWSARLEVLTAAADDSALYAEVSAHAAKPAASAALALLALWLRPAAESSFSERALKDLAELWLLTTDPWYSWPAAVPTEVLGLIAAAQSGDWPRLADAATRLLRRGPDLSGVSRSAGEDFRAALSRLAHRRGQRSRVRRTSS